MLPFFFLREEQSSRLQFIRMGDRPDLPAGGLKQPSRREGIVGWERGSMQPNFLLLPYAEPRETLVHRRHRCL